MKIQNISKIRGGRQDGAICNGFMFSFNHQGDCVVYEIDSIENMKDGEAEVFAEFTLDKKELIVPHSNSVMFGNSYYDKNDEFPLLYSNIYNNYAREENKLKGVTLVYRVQRDGKTFTTTLVQMIEIGFVEDETLWKSAGEKEDARPYGNFAIDLDKDIYYAFTMRDNTNSTRYFAFKMPGVNQGEMCEKYNVKKVVLNSSDILHYFDCDYHHFVQGACCNDGKIYSLEGFTDHPENLPAIRIIDTELKEQVLYKQFRDLGTNIEPEFIYFYNNECYYVDHYGNVYKLYF